MRNTFVYWMFNSAGECLYVGATRYPERRWRQHIGDKEWIGQVSARRMAGPFDKATALRLERQQQDELQPRYDRRQAIMRARAKALPNAPTRWALADLFDVAPDENDSAA